MSNRKVRRSRSEWEQLISLYEASGQTQQVFCREQGIALSTFCKWRSVLADDIPAAQPSLFTEIALAPEAARGERGREPEWEYELELGGGVVLRFRRRGAPC